MIIFEDEAESFSDIGNNGHDLADFTMFSFGTIKPFSAYGGGITVIRNNEGLYRKMKQILDSYKFMDNSYYLKKIVKNSGVYLALNVPFINKNARKIFNKIDFDYKNKFVGLVRGFQTTPQTFLSAFRQ